MIQQIEVIKKEPLEQSSELIVAEHSHGVNLMTPQYLQEMVDIETANRKILTQYISQHLKEGEDYGKIHVVSKSKCAEPYNCKNSYHFSKPSLFKAGTEKFVSLFKLRPTFDKDSDTWEMSGKKTGLFCYVCRLIDNRGNVVSEGRGSCDVSEKSSMNEAIKLAQKRAQTDAVLRHGALSDVFTQDLEDIPLDSISSHSDKPRQDKALIGASQSQIDLMKRLCEEQSFYPRVYYKLIMSHLHIQETTGGKDGTASQIIGFLIEQSKKYSGRGMSTHQDWAEENNL